jgi:beta-mannosidase
MPRTRIALTWRVGHSATQHELPTLFVPATVPGAVQLDWAAAHGWPEPAYDSDVSKYGWMEDVYWRYQTTLTVSLTGPLFFVCAGVDYQCAVFLDGVQLHAQEGMFAGFEIDMGTRAKPGAQIDVLVWPAPKSCRSGDRNEANASVKPAVSYEWDFHPRLVPLGIWDETYLESRPEVHVRDAEVRYTLSDDFGSAAVTCAIDTAGNAPRLSWQLRDPDGAIVHEQTAAGSVKALSTKINQPRLWWPNGQGEQALYTSIVTLLDANGAALDSAQQRIGFKRARLLMHPAQWEEPEVAFFPKGRHTSPVSLEINGRRVFAKGANWVSPDIFPGRIDADTYAPLINMARVNNFNMLRCWGGAIIQKEAFFEQCDALGIMVWQEFPLACNRYEGTPEYLAVLDTEAQAIVRRVRRHVSLTMWCGGNELFNNWSKMTDQDLALRLLNSVCYQLDPQRPFLMTSPMMGMAHGGYFFRSDAGDEVYQYFARSKNTAYTEFGVPGSASAALLRKIIPAGELFPPKLGTQWQTRHAFRSWQINSWLDLHTIEHYFGPCKTLEQLVERSQWLQAEGYKAIFEEGRRQKPVCAMTLNWVMNEPWPSAANNSLVSWPAEPKPALAAVGESCRGVLASARIPKFSWRGGEAFTSELWLLNDSPDALPAGVIEAWVHVGGKAVHALTWSHPAAVANTNLHGPTLRMTLPEAASEHMLTLELRTPGAPGRASTYRLHYAPGAPADEVLHTMGDV